MNIIVSKFGGTSVGSPEAIQKLREIVLEKEERKIIVVSAVSGTTDLLIKAGTEAKQKGDWEITLEIIKKKHLKLIKELGIKLDLSEYFEELEAFLNGIESIGELTPRSRDYILSFGERLSSKIIESFLEKKSKAIRINSRKLIKTDNSFSSAKLDMKETIKAIKKNLLPKLNDFDKIVITGFIGSTAHGEYTTFSRGGSDYTAAILANVLNATELEIWTDVDGILTANPKIIPQAKVIPKINYREAAELAYFGAKVLHPKTIEPVVVKEIPARVVNTFNHKHRGTLITGESQKNINLLAQQTSPLPEKEALLQELSQEVVQLQQEKLEEKKGQADELLERTSELLVKNETILHHSLEIQQKISTLDLCPTCLQAVSPEHQHKILDEEEQKTQQAQNLLFEMNKKKLLIIEQREKLQEKIQRLFLKENLFLRTQAEVTRLYEKKNELLEKQKQVTRWIQENNQLITQLETILQDEEQQNLDQKLSYYQELQNRWIQKQHLEQQVQDLQIHQQQQQSENDLLLQQAQQKEQELMRYPDKSRDVPEKKIQIASLGEKEKELTVHQAQLAAQKNQLVRQEQELQQVLATLTAERNKFIHLQELHHWLNDYFIPVTVTIEKQVMITIHSLFNQLFQEWFSILMEGENIFSRIDDSFSPIIEQNGYETPFENLSGGEKTSVALAYRLALNRVINDVVHQIKTKDLLILDEPTDGFSSEQLDKVREVLERLHLQQTIIVSHESKIESFVDKVVRIQKEGHVSGVVQ